MLSDYALHEFCRPVAKAAQQPALLAATQALIAQPVWDASLLLAQTQALCVAPVMATASEPLAVALRRLRSAAVAALAALDLSHAASLETVTGNITLLAEFALHTVLRSTGAELALRYGAPSDAQGQGIDIQVIAMGKMGGCELNISSDIDLIFLARTVQGDTAGVAVQGLLRQCSNSEFLNQWARSAVNLLNTPTADGFVFRVDTMLRPHGSAGPLVVEHAMLDDYLLTQGRMWERLAWLKARGVATPVFESPAAHAAGHAAWAAVVQPFVYRRYLDFTVVDALRDVHSRIRAERRSHEAKAGSGLHVKLARGGIRELEFWVQGQQLIRGGRDASVRPRGTLAALAALLRAGVIAAEAAADMAGQYRLLRRVEHAMQYREDAQTHTLPADAALRATTAQALGFDAAPALEAALLVGMNAVAAAFDGLFARHGGDQARDVEGLEASDEAGATLNTARTSAAGAAAAPPNHTAWLQDWLDKAVQLPISDATRLVVNRLLRQIAGLDSGKHGDTGDDKRDDKHDKHDDHDVDIVREQLDRVAAFILSIAKRKTYLDVLVLHPPALARLQALMCASPFAAQYLHDHPALLDELIDTSTLYLAMDAAYWQTERQRAWARLEGLDEEAQLHVLREVHHTWVLRVLAQDLAGRIDVRAVSDALSQAADIALDAALCCLNAKLYGRFDLPAGLVIIAYGKLGGKELGYASDLDIVFVYDPALAGEAAAFYPRLVQRLISWLGMQTVAGRLFEIDTALRPNGQAGLMLSTVSAFADYQLGDFGQQGQQGRSAGTHAWLWEHQAISRARIGAGDRRVEQGFDAIRTQVLRLPRDPVALSAQVHEMRRKVAQAHPVPEGLFDAKHSAGGMVDIEFAVQLMVLRHAAQHPALLGNVGNIALLHAGAQAGIVPAPVAVAAGLAYGLLRSVQHQCKLQGQLRAHIPLDSAAARQCLLYAADVQALWRCVND
jgi:[glutamine synthetase] adenylyltransferase / [glutamine synthetase]-adenylyl-L-tyrosine phosphorylase